MSWLGSLLGGGVGEVATAVGSAAKDIEDVFTTSDREKLEQYRAETDRLEVEQANELAQVRVNQTEARHHSVFVAGWRPFIGWVCGAAMVFHFLIQPMFGEAIEKYAGYPLADLNWQELSVVLMGLLGLGGLRTFEKAKGIARSK